MWPPSRWIAENSSQIHCAPLHAAPRSTSYMREHSALGWQAQRPASGPPFLQGSCGQPDPWHGFPASAWDSDMDTAVRRKDLGSAPLVVGPIARPKQGQRRATSQEEWIVFSWRFGQENRAGGRLTRWVESQLEKDTFRD